MYTQKSTTAQNLEYHTLIKLIAPSAHYSTCLVSL